MYAPIYFAAAMPPSRVVVAAERAIVEAEGPAHVAGRYIADAACAATARWQEAERRVAAAEQLARYLAGRRCHWCGRPFVPDSAFEIVGGEPVHAQPCLSEVHAALLKHDADAQGDAFAEAA